MLSCQLEACEAVDAVSGSPAAAAAPSASPFPTEERQRKRQRTRVVGFSTVQIYSHDPCLAGDRVTSTPGPPVGLGALRAVTMQRIESFDESRVRDRTGVQYLDAEARRGLVIKLSRSDSIDDVINDVSLTREQRQASLADQISPRSPRTEGFPALGEPQPLDEAPSLSDLFG